jgi:hypothetical protein
LKSNSIFKEDDNIHSFDAKSEKVDRRKSKKLNKTPTSSSSSSSEQDKSDNNLNSIFGSNLEARNAASCIIEEDTILNKSGLIVTKRPKGRPRKAK